MDFLHHPIPILGRPCRNRPNRDYHLIAETRSCLRLIPIQTCPAYRSQRTQFGRIFQLRISAEIIGRPFTARVDHHQRSMVCYCVLQCSRTGQLFLTSACVTEIAPSFALQIFASVFVAHVVQLQPAALRQRNFVFQDVCFGWISHSIRLPESSACGFDRKLFHMLKKNVAFP